MIVQRASTRVEKLKVHFSVTSTAAQAQPAEMFVVASTKNELGGLRSLLVSSINKGADQNHKSHSSNKPVFLIGG